LKDSISILLGFTFKKDLLRASRGFSTLIIMENIIRLKLAENPCKT